MLLLQAFLRIGRNFIVWEGDLFANIIIFGFKSIAKLVRSEPPKPVEVPALLNSVWTFGYFTDFGKTSEIREN